jgi:hypothetical protein
LSMNLRWLSGTGGAGSEAGGEFFPGGDAIPSSRHFVLVIGQADLRPGRMRLTYGAPGGPSMRPA